MLSSSRPTAVSPKLSTRPGALPSLRSGKPIHAFRTGQLPPRKQIRLAEQWRTHAEGDNNQQEPEAKPDKPTVAPPRGKRKEEDQTVAIVTGAISVIIGFIYLFGVILLNGRGNQLVPPPPEAYGWILSGMLREMM